MQTAVSEQLAGCPAAPNIDQGSNPSSPHPPHVPLAASPGRAARTLTQRGEEAVPGARGGQGGVGFGEQVPAGFRGLPAGQVGELGPGPGLHAARGERLEDGVLDALGTAAAGEERA